MREYKIIIGESIGDIRLGMTSREAQARLVEYKENNYQPYGGSRMVHESISEDFIVSYNEHDRVDFICFNNFTEAMVTLDDLPLSEIGCFELFTKIHDLDPEAEVDSEGFISNALGFGVTFVTESLTDSNGREHICEMFDTLQVVTKDFWKEN